MSPSRPTSVRIDEDILEGLRMVHERDGVPQTEQIRRALRAWLTERGVMDAPQTKTARKRAATRKRA